MRRSTTAAGEVQRTRDLPTRPTAIAAEVEALLDHIAEDLAREYVRVMEQAAQEHSADTPRWRGQRDA